MSYRYEPATKETEELCVLLGNSMPDVQFHFGLNDDGFLRVAGVYRDRYYEQLLRNSHTPQAVATVFAERLKCQQAQPTA